jgi:amino acid adenylation domain-containing protein
MVTPRARNLADVRRELLEMRARQRQTETTERSRIVPVPREGRLAVSEQQRYLWFLHQFAPESPVYNEPHALRVRGELDTAALAQAFCGLVARHEGLRTRFGDEDGVPYQIIDPAPLTWSLPVSDGAQTSIQHWVDATAWAPFDLAKGPVCRFSLLRIAPDDHVLIMVWHHIVNDGWSTRLMSEELAARYAAARRGTDAALPDLVIQPADHAAWQRPWLLGDEAAGQVGYWREALADAPPLEFPADRPRPAQPTGAGAVFRSALPAELGQALRDYARIEGVSLFAVMLAVFQVVLSRYTGQSDLVFGTLLPGRTRSELEPLAGFFVNTVVLRGRLAGNPAFLALSRQCDETMFDAIAHQDVPFGTLVEALKPERVSGRNPLFQHLFTLMPASMVPLFQLEGLRVEELAARRDTSRFDLSVQVTDEPGGGIGFFVEYSTELYDQDRMQRLVGHLVTGLSSALAAPDDGVDSLNILPDAESSQLLTQWNPAPSAHDGRCLHEVFSARAAQAPDRVAMRFAGADLSYGELDLRSNRLANLLARSGVTPGQVVGVLLERGFDLPVAELGVLKAGGAWLPLDSQYPAERVAYQLQDADVSLVVTTSDLAGQLPASVSPVLLDSGVLDDEPGPAPAGRTSPEAVAYVIYTSGSTGKPKGVMVPHRAAVNFCAAYRELFAVTPGDRILQFSNPAFDVSVSDFFATFASGATVVGAPRRELLDPDSLQALMRDERITFGDIPPAVLRLLDPEPLADLRVLFIGMEPFGPELVNRWARPGRQFHNGYGPTEATITCVDYLCPDQVLTGQPPIGRAMANQRAYVLDQHLRLAPIGVPGELYMAGAGLAHGYLGRPDLTAEKFLPDPYAPRRGEHSRGEHSRGERMYATGDLARWRADGNLEFLGRVDRQVKIRGLRIEPGEIEYVLASYPGVRQAAVVVREAGTPQAQLIGYLVPSPGHQVDPGQVRDYAGERLALHMIPAALLCLPQLPLTPAGKLDPARLPDPQAQAGTDRAELSTDTQRRLAGIWRELLGPGCGEIGALDSFFNLGGNSLQVTRVISRIRDSMRVTLEPRDLFTHPVLEQLASQIDGALRPAHDETVVAELTAEIAELSEAELDRLLDEDRLRQADHKVPEE